MRAGIESPLRLVIGNINIKSIVLVKIAIVKFELFVLEYIW